ncbi:4-hydroxy-3-methylbut-2-enyl diphosphate reductase [Candidatus Mesenet endosymbiont of Agriotes lineatus]|uniref:4-hydroxy-3-methylbut-2-enyl diphosphate reductase n=1 Tax=Candidatus Mesenet endosymbiont of Agriotes lineatus TaxID=3077948 RepID=UPI0030CC7691
MEIILAQPRGFCAGVKRAIDILTFTLERYGSNRKIYALHEIVHNKYVVEDFKHKGVTFVSKVKEVPDGAALVFSAHGVARSVEDEAKSRNIFVIDATCPLVSKVHREAQKSEQNGRQLILIGHKGHPEIEGTKGRVKKPVILVQTLQDVYELEVEDPDKLSYVTQTTLSIDDTREIITALQTRFPNISGPNLSDICYATQNRQNAVKKLAQVVDLVLVIGSQNSSNSNRLLDICRSVGVKSYLINSYRDIDNSWLDSINKLGITAGASAPEILIEELISYLKGCMTIKVSVLPGIVENIEFKLPPELKDAELVAQN